MTTTEEPKGIPGLKPPKLEDLPEEERKIYEQQLASETLYGDFSEDKAEIQKEIPKTEVDNWMKEISKQAGKDLAYYAQFDKYDIEMDDGHTEKWYRVSPTDYEWDELEDMRAEVEGGEAMDDGHKLTKREVRQKTKLLEQLKAKYYLRNSKTNNPMMPEDKAHVKNAAKIGAILDACVVVSLHKAVVGKK